MELCNCRYSICDMGYFECQLPKGHEGNHFFKEDDFDKRTFNISWEQNQKLDIIFNKEKVFELTNLQETLEIVVNTFDTILDYTLSDKEFNEPLYGPDFTLNIEFSLNIEFDDTSPESYFQVTDEIMKKFFEVFNVEYKQLHISLNYKPLTTCQF